MGYWAEKLKVEKKIKILKRVGLGVLLLIFTGLCIFGFFVPPKSWKYYFGLPNIGKRAKDELRIHFLDVGQGDCTLIELPDGKTMLIDGGKDVAAEKSILRYLNALKIDTIDYLVVTHADEDHCGGLAEVLSWKKIVNAYLPLSSVEKDSAYATFYAAILKEDCARKYASRSEEFPVLDESCPYTLSFLYPYTLDVEELPNGEENTVEDENLRSSVLWLDYHGVSALFTGDAPIEIAEKLMRDDSFGFLVNRGVELSSTEILKVAHHGSADGTNAAFVEYLGVETAVISCGEENRYGHPAPAVTAILDNANVTTYRTDLHGHIVITISPDGSYKTEKIS